MFDDGKNRKCIKQGHMHSGAGCTLHKDAWPKGCCGGQNPASCTGKATDLGCSCVSLKKGYLLKLGSSTRIPVSNSQKGIIV